VGDLIVDSTWYVNAKKLSPEAPVPTLYLTTPEPINSPGGASLAATYANRYSIKSEFVTVAETKFFKWLQNKGIQITSLIDNLNIVKTRYIDIESGYHVVRVDNDDIITPCNVLPLQMRTTIEDIITKHNIKCIALFDYVKGVFNNADTCHSILSIAKQNNIPIYVDTKGSILKYIGADYLKLNEKEYIAAATALRVDGPLELAKRLRTEGLIVTKGKKGASLYTTKKDKEFEFIPDLIEYTGTPDVTGCGDVFDVNFCYNKFILGLDPTESLRLSVKQATKFAYEPVNDRL
jgi:bifunctional ADP-heptose synthase (sugar kinase/adenylyltransferase)